MNEVILGFLLTGLVTAVAWLWLSLHELQSRFAALEAEANALREANRRGQERLRDSQTLIHQHLARLEAEHSAIKRKQDDQIMRQGVSKTFDAAVNLARKGAAPEEVMESCGLSLGEAELLCRIYRSTAVPPSGHRPDLSGPLGKTPR